MKLTIKKLPNGDFVVLADRKPLTMVLTLDVFAREWDAFTVVPNTADVYAYDQCVASSKSRSRLLENLQAFASVLAQA
jgi:hypothetical protein